MRGTALCFVVRCLRPAQAMLVSQKSSSGNLGYWIAAMRGTLLCVAFAPLRLCWFRKILLRILLGVYFPRYAGLRRAFELRSHLITRHKKSPTLVRRAFFEIGAGDEIRTHDILVGNEMLYH